MQTTFLKDAILYPSMQRVNQSRVKYVPVLPVAAVALDPVMEGLGGHLQSSLGPALLLDLHDRVRVVHCLYQAHILARR